MVTTREDISLWLEKGKKQRDITHMLVVCDTYEYEDYPVYVSLNQNVHDVFNSYDKKNMQRVMEVYSYRQNLKTQLEQERVFNFD